MKKVLVVAPHPDDETLGCGGTLLKHKKNNDLIHLLVVTGNNSLKDEFSINRREEIQKVVNSYGFNDFLWLDFSACQLDHIPFVEIIKKVSPYLELIKPDTLYVPYRNDAHSDHRVVFDVMASCSKTFRYPFVKSFYAYETLSETDFSIKPDDFGFKPNLYVNIEEFIDKKIEIMQIYKTEVGEFPFPRSQEAIVALSKLRGVQSGCVAAEAFMIMKEIR